VGLTSTLYFLNLRTNQSAEPEALDWKDNPAPKEFAHYEPGQIYALSGSEINDMVLRVTTAASKFTFNWVYEAMRKNYEGE